MEECICVCVCVRVRVHARVRVIQRGNMQYGVLIHGKCCITADLSNHTCNVFNRRVCHTHISVCSSSDGERGVSRLCS